MLARSRWQLSFRWTWLVGAPKKRWLRVKTSKVPQWTPKSTVGWLAPSPKSCFGRLRPTAIYALHGKSTPTSGLRPSAELRESSMVEIHQATVKNIAKPAKTAKNRQKTNNSTNIKNHKKPSQTKELIELCNEARNSSCRSVLPKASSWKASRRDRGLETFTERVLFFNTSFSKGFSRWICNGFLLWFYSWGLQWVYAWVFLW